VSSTQSLLTVLSHAERERDRAFVEARRLAQTHQSALHQVDQLMNYRREYQQRWSEQFKRSGEINIVQCYQRFMTRLDQAIAQQERVVQHAAQHSKRAADVLRQHETYVLSVRKLLERRTQKLRSEEAQRAQKQADDQASAARRNRPTDSGLLSVI